MSILLLKEGETFKVKCHPLTMPSKVVIFNSPPFPRSATVQTEIVPTAQYKFQPDY